ncbi:helicase-related protein [Celeribacter indicus]|uniref:DNA/RNA helicase-like protein n=1 Tax=Celeribacter indicus TaxID=1208324 RepID=A0A0B5E4M6_9RHOB|nr:helicase-related protein [Celeribacter indicus]AJE47996.1 DNA/RNA helicase-like protein [Celeribacter indicus]SDW28982.1 ATP-dependent RNA helicase SUPV3L1/SUV3 [Celeribacter indicus]
MQGASGAGGRITAVLGPTNTGKTHYAIDRMLAHRTGVIGLPLRLLAREVYDRIVAARGPSVVALVTGEERIVPPRAQYWVCTVEAMPTGMGADFLAVDEIQLCADPERGHVFTDRLLHARGLHETLFLGSDTMRSVIAELVPKAQFMRRERFSRLTYSGSKKISRMPARAAIVGFSVDDVYAIAELLRRQKGGAAVVMGALSPRTRNAQVAMYQNGDVDYLVATDAIGMGLNLDVTHVAFSSLVKFDGRRMRHLAPNELAQIAGRAGRYQTDGTFGVTGEAEPLDADVIEAIEEHRFTPQKKLQWRNSALEFGSVDALIGSLERAPGDPALVRAREADDLLALKTLADLKSVRPRLRTGRDVRLLWDVCRIPDFRSISHNEHSTLLERIFEFLHEYGRVPDDWLAGQIKRIDRTEGNIDTLSKRLAYIRTWTYVAQRTGWVDDESHWRDATRAVEDRLSDALHGALTQRFVDRRTSVLLRRLKQKEGLVADVNDKGEVTVEGEFIGRLEGFRFIQDKAAHADEAKTLAQAAMTALAPEFSLRADRFYNAPDTEMDFTDQGGLMWGEHAVGKLVPGDEAMRPRAVAFVDEGAGADVTEKVQRRLQHFIDRKVATLFEPLLALAKDEMLQGIARGFAFRLSETYGVIPRDTVAQEVKELDQDARGALRKHGVRFGQFTIFMPALLKPAPTRLRLLLWALNAKFDEFPEAPPPGLVTIPAVGGAPEGYYPMSGYRLAGERAIRIDMLERLADLLRAQDSRGGFEANPDMLSITGMTLEQFAGLMEGLGYRAEKAERTKVKAVDQVVPTDEGVAHEDVVPPLEEGAENADRPVFDAGTPEAVEPGAVTGEAAEPAAADAVPAAETYPDEDIAPIAETAPAEGDPDADIIPDVSSEEVPTGTSPDAPLAGAEIETFYTFTWGGNRGGHRGGNRRSHGGGDRPQGKKGGGKPKGKGPRRDNGGTGKGGTGPKTFSARPPRKEKAIDPDNPFAAALMGLKDKS